MSADEKLYTEREMVLAQREAFNAGVFARDQGRDPPDGCFTWKKLVATRYPLPKVTRPRIVHDPLDYNLEWTVEDGYLRCRRSHVGQRYEWQKWSDFKGNGDGAPLAERVKLWADLFANPTEEVEE